LGLTIFFAPIDVRLLRASKFEARAAASLDRTAIPEVGGLHHRYERRAA
jgi:hypothetical protein